MPLTPSELSVLKEIERELSVDRPRSVTWRRPVIWIGVWLVGAGALVVGGLVADNTASIVLGVAWAVAAVVSLWVSRHLDVVSTRR